MTMATVSVSVPDDLRKKMVKADEVNWSSVARKAFEQRLAEIEALRRIAAKSKLTQEDADEISALVRKGTAKRFDKIASGHRP